MFMPFKHLDENFGKLVDPVSNIPLSMRSAWTVGNAEILVGLGRDKNVRRCA